MNKIKICLSGDDKIMIPKVIHYCWFGGNPLPELAQICIDSWKKYLPDYEIKEWNETNFDLNSCEYIKEAYKCKKWAFVSDYARFWILYKYGGLYFDTDVEIINPIDDIIRCGSFMGFENMGNSNLKVSSGLGLGANPGLGLGANPGLGIYKEILDMYREAHFINEDGTLNLITIVDRTTSILRNHGLKNENVKQTIEGITIYPFEYFCPIDCATGKKHITQNTRSIHWYMDSWGSEGKAEIIKRQRSFEKYGVIIGKVGKIITLPKRIHNRMKNDGFRKMIKYCLNKIAKI